MSLTKYWKAHHEGALTPPCIVWKKPQVPHTARQVACHSLNNSRGKQSSIPPHKTRPDSPVPTLQGPCDLSQKWRGTLGPGHKPRKTPISWSALDKNPMPAHHFEGNPVDESTSRRGTDTAVHCLEKTAGSTHRSEERRVGKEC